jgi:Undecaprenyl-phosphate galactose phosphotransferase WbaP
VKRILLRVQRWGCRAVIYGDSQTVPVVVEALREEAGLGYVPFGLFLDNPETAPEISNVRVLGDIHESCRCAPIAVVALPRLAREALSDLLEGPLSGYRKIIIIPDLQEAPSLWVKPRDLVGMLGLEISINLLDPLARISKRTMDLTAVLLTAPLWAPLCLLLAALIWWQDRANPLFLQERVGRGGGGFRTWKFRTMHPDAERILQEHLDRDPDLQAEWQRNFKLRKDPRITRMGRLLRRTSLDELPQLINVLRGEMSLVGPRPLPAYHFQQLPERVRKLRDRVRPGVTGLWQVSGRSDAGHLGMARWDTYYVRNWSIWLDIVILVRTWRAVIGCQGAF